MIQDNFKYISAKVEGFGEINIVSDDSLDKGSVIAETQFGTLDGSVTTRLEQAKKVILDLETARAEKKAARNAFFEREAELLCETEENLVLSFADATQDELRALANKAISKIGGILVLLSGKDGEYKYILASEKVDLKGEVKKINAALCGRGGGSSVMAQGSFTATLSEIEKYFT
jgi:alanyl-tRNA synthetase